MTTIAPTTDLADQARRRARLAGLLGRLLVAEPGPELAELVADVPALRPLGTDDPDLASEYERLFLREVAPYESTFLGPDGQRGGDVAAAVRDAYLGHGFRVEERWRIAGADHLGAELHFLASLAAEEAIAWEHDRPDEAARLVDESRAFLADHLGRWGEVAAAALRRRAGGGPYASLSDALEAFLAEESERLRPAPDHPGMPPVAVIEPPDRLTPARLARWLLAPVTCGGYLDVDDLGQAALSLGIPWRPSDPRSRLRQALEAAADGGDLPDLLAAIEPVVAAWRDRHARFVETRDGDRRTWQRWLAQSERTLAVLERQRAARPRPHPEQARPLVVVEAPDLHSQIEVASSVVTRLRAAGLSVTVSLAEPDLPAGLGTLLDAGAEEVLLTGGRRTAAVWSDGGSIADRERRHLPAADVHVRVSTGFTALHLEPDPDRGERWRRVHDVLDGIGATARGGEEEPA